MPRDEPGLQGHTKASEIRENAGLAMINEFEMAKSKTASDIEFAKPNAKVELSSAKRVDT